MGSPAWWPWSLSLGPKPPRLRNAGSSSTGQPSPPTQNAAKEPPPSQRSHPSHHTQRQAHQPCAGRSRVGRGHHADQAHVPPWRRQFFHHGSRVSVGARKQGPRGPGSHPLGAGTGQHRSHSPRLSAAGAGVTWWLKQRWPPLAAAGLPPAPRNTALFPRQPTESWFTESRCSHHGPSKLCKVMGFPGKVAGDRHRSDFGVRLRVLGAGQTLASSWDELGASPEEGVL